MLSSDNDSRSSLLASIGGQVDGNNSDTDYNPEDDDYSEADPAPVDEQYELVNRAVARRDNNASEIVQVKALPDNDLRRILPAQQQPQPHRDLRQTIARRRTHLPSAESAGTGGGDIEQQMLPCMSQLSPISSSSEQLGDVDQPIMAAGAQSDIPSFESSNQQAQTVSVMVPQFSDLDMQLAEVAARDLFCIEDPSDYAVQAIAEFISRHPTIVKHGQSAVDTLRMEKMEMSIELKRANATLAAREADLAAQTREEVDAREITDSKLSYKDKLIGQLRSWRSEMIRGNGMGKLGNKLTSLEDEVGALRTDKQWLQSEIRRMWDENCHREKIFEDLDKSFMRQIRPPPGWMTEISGEENEAVAQAPVSSQVDEPGPSRRQRHASSRSVASRRSSLDSGLASRPSSRLKRCSGSRVKEEKVYSVPTTSESESEGSSDVSSDEDVRSPPPKRAGQRDPSVSESSSVSTPKKKGKHSTKGKDGRKNKARK